MTETGLNPSAQSPAVFFSSVPYTTLDGSVSATSGALAALGRGITSAVRRMKFASDIRHASKLLQKLIDVAKHAVEKTDVADIAVQPKSPEDLDHGLRTIEYLEMITGRMILSLERYGWSNDSKTAGTVRNLKIQQEQLSDIVDWLHAGIRNSSETLEREFMIARREYEHGESYTLDEVF